MACNRQEKSVECKTGLLEISKERTVAPFFAKQKTSEKMFPSA
jgi:hypothetical protein